MKLYELDNYLDPLGLDETWYNSLNDAVTFLKESVSTLPNWMLITFVQRVRWELFNHAFTGIWKDIIGAVIASSWEDDVFLFLQELIVLCEQIESNYQTSKEARVIDCSVLRNIFTQMQDFVLFLLDRKKYIPSSRDNDDTFISPLHIRSMFIVFQVLVHACYNDRGMRGIFRRALAYASTIETYPFEMLTTTMSGKTFGMDILLIDTLIDKLTVHGTVDAIRQVYPEQSFDSTILHQVAKTSPDALRLLAPFFRDCWKHDMYYRLPSTIAVMSDRFTYMKHGYLLMEMCDMYLFGPYELFCLPFPLCVASNKGCPDLNTVYYVITEYLTRHYEPTCVSFRSSYEKIDLTKHPFTKKRVHSSVSEAINSSHKALVGENSFD